MKKIIVYSVNINGYDEFNEPKVYDPNVEYILFTDDNTIKSDIWKITPVDFIKKNIELRKKSRYLKINSHLVLPPHDISIYVDHCFESKFSDVNKMLDDINFHDKNIMAYKHPERNCTYDEANTVLQYRLDTINVVSNQMKRYTNMGFPKQYGLFEGGFIFRKSNDKIKNFNETWWNEVLKNSGRDQLSQMFASWYSDVYIHPITIGEKTESTPYLNPRKEHKRVFQTKK
jgi:hypothetical protein